MRTITTLIALLSAHALLGCSSSDPTPAPGPEDELLEAPAPGEGVQYRMTSVIEPGQEIERCQLFVAPPEGLNIQRDEVRYSGGSHHVLLYATNYTEIPTETRRGVPIDAAEVHDCKDGATADWEVSGVISGSQSPEGNSLLGPLPEGVAVKVKPGTVLVMNTHYLNSSLDPMETDARINLYTIPDEEVKTEAGMLFHYNPIIRVPARGESSARMRCTTEQDIFVVRIQSHMHRRGVGYVANLVKSDDSTQELYAHDKWEQVPSGEFDPVLEVKAGEALDYRCDYRNPEERDVVQGQTTRDEMCMLVGPYYPRSPSYENCRNGDGEFAGTWIGSGTATCAESLACLSGARSPDEDQGFDSYGCVVDSCAGAGEELSAVLQCQWSQGHGACTDACAESPEACGACIATACADAVTACEAAACE
ncbi:hypothetical protein SOCEGT47_059810 [Sorangium cellulosum]|uniref:Copper type II ascorbate-dependent monooxygenase C-terminal domain-containing protein n=1 Tax=Sorangium cellulosum TaxID=56 RepID=A0A4P2Q7D6_SORCE|nr:hypothetical protein [Sorangium cellulosum]AUX25434.1 hypothetical protein SOCEGT47_059810 [Sorangium cellulosum]